MSKYAALESIVYGVFDSSAWKAKSIAAIPRDYLPKTVLSEFVRISVLPQSSVKNLGNSRGLLQIEIYTQAGLGSKRQATIADALDSVLEGKHFANNLGSLQLFVSSVRPDGVDTVNKNLTRSTYTIPFTFFGAN